MKVLINVGHPAHVHVFKNFVWEMERRGHETLISAVDKDVTIQLLDAYRLKYVTCGKRGKGFVSFAWEVIRRDVHVYRLVRRFKPDFVMGIADLFGAQVSTITKTTSLVFTDTEIARIGNMLTFPFADAVCTPSCFKRDLGRKQLRYDGYHQLAYLHPNYFRPDPSVLSVLGLAEGEKLVVMRFGAFQASHDAGVSGFSMQAKRKMVDDFRRHGRVVITSESQLPEDLRQYQLKLSPEQLHSILFYSDLYVGDVGATTAEAALLGAPSVQCVRLRERGKVFSAPDLHGTFWELQNRYGLLYSFMDEEEAIRKAAELLHTEGAKKAWKSKVDNVLADKIDVTAFMTWIVEDYPRNIEQIRHDVHLQERFRRGH
jgi:hypothetical protein